jgi:hypothetical protein
LDSLEDESSDDFDINPPYPSYRFDQFLRQQSENYWAVEQRREVLDWASGIPTQNPDEGP